MFKLTTISFLLATASLSTLAAPISVAGSGSAVEAREPLLPVLRPVKGCLACSQVARDEVEASARDDEVEAPVRDDEVEASARDDEVEASAHDDEVDARGIKPMRTFTPFTAPLPREELAEFEARGVGRVEGSGPRFKVNPASAIARGELEARRYKGIGPTAIAREELEARRYKGIGPTSIAREDMELETRGYKGFNTPLLGTFAREDMELAARGSKGFNNAFVGTFARGEVEARDDQEYMTVRELLENYLEARDYGFEDLE